MKTIKRIFMGACLLSLGPAILLGACYSVWFLLIPVVPALLLASYVLGALIEETVSND